ncbi:hypothetical protein COI89_22695, partial [Bacillus cereus]
DKVKVLHKSQWKLQNPGTHFEQGIAPDNSISKVTEKAPENKSEDYVVGSIIDVYKNEFTVEYKGNDGKDHLVVAKHNDQQTFNEGDKVKVLYKSQWKLQNPGTHFEQGIAPDNSISKVTK